MRPSSTVTGETAGRLIPRSSGMVSCVCHPSATKKGTSTTRRSSMAASTSPTSGSWSRKPVR
ncbi:MAG TPA: hypothetical protein VHG51_16265, partial [Longimicrobiaceae bacterium]|nr:hypothetical protein [Longimicrobiaceae bacterium]